MIRVAIGLVLLISGVSAEDYALQYGYVEPSINQILALCLTGFALLLWGYPSFRRKLNDD